MATATLRRIKKSSFFRSPAYDNANTTLCIGLDPQTGLRKNIFKTKEEREEFEEELGLRGQLDMNSDYYKNLSIVFTGDSIVLDEDNMMDKLYLKMLENDSFVAMSEADLLNKSEAKFILTKDAEVSQNKVDKRRVKAEAYIIFGKMNIEDMKNALLVLGKNPKSLSEIKIKELISDEVEERPAKFLSIVTDTDFNNKVFINALIQENIIFRNGSVYMFDNEPIAHDLMDMTSYLKNKKNANMVLTFKKMLNDKTGFKTVEE